MELTAYIAATKRTYRQSARALVTQEHRARIASTFYDLLAERWIDEITLDEIALAVGTTRQTVLRAFENKEGLLAAALREVELKAAPRFDGGRHTERSAAINDLIDHYEAVGDMVFRLLAQESRHPALRPLLAQGRQMHRDWVRDRLYPREQDGGIDEARLTRLIAATDVYTWKLLRRDLQTPRDEVADLLTAMVASLSASEVTS